MYGVGRNSEKVSTLDRVRVCPSLLNADLLRLDAILEEFARLGIKALHMDVMDGHFVRHISFGASFIDKVTRGRNFLVDTHLMVTNAESCLQEYIAVSDCVSVHVEAVVHLDGVLRAVQAQGKAAGIAINPSTPLEHIVPVLSLVDRVIVMSVNPGLGGQSFIPYVYEKIQALRDVARVRNPRLVICVDGGVQVDNIRKLRDMGVAEVVVGSFFYGGESIAHQWQRLQAVLAD